VKRTINQHGPLGVHLTAAEAYPALEKLFLGAKTEIWASFLVFDLRTRLRSDAGLKVGRTWFDLLVHVLKNGVAVHFVISDVDPIARPQMHRDATQSLRMFIAAAEIAGPSARLHIVAARHPAETGAALRMLIWPYIQRKLRKVANWLNRQPPDKRRAALRDMPGLADSLRLRRDDRVAVRLWILPRLYPVTHHQKLAVFDRARLYIGGLDLDERRYDTPEHRRPGEQTWHDLQLTLQGPVVAEAQRHLEQFRTLVAGGAADHAFRRLLVTISRQRPFNLFHFGPEPMVNQVLNGHTVLAQRAKRLIYLETQYFRDRGFARQLARRARQNPALTMILILPAAPDDVAFDKRQGLDARLGEALQARALRIIRKAFGDRLFVGSPAQQRRAPRKKTRDMSDADGRDQLHGAPLVYVHAKVSLFDDHAAIVSSANLNGRSFYWDTEAGVYLNKPTDVADLRQRVMAHWLPDDAGPAALSIDTAAATWAALARRNARARPEDRNGFLLPYDFAAAEVFGRTLPLIPDEMV
jgi:phosphatidylserine/phosphatidylglycerophosphate/cardiolipin synthase-like enzyme